MGEALSLPFFQRALAAGVLTAVACGIVGTFVVVKRISSMSGGLAHAAFGGVGLGYFLGIPPLLGAIVFALASGAGIGVAYRRLRAGFDTLISMVWTVGMAIGLVFIALTPGYAPDLMGYLFGNILFVAPDYLLWVLALDGVVLVLVALFFKELRAFAFDEEFAEATGLPVGFLVQLLLVLVSLTVVVLIRVVGVILVIALLTIPAAAAKPWSTGIVGMMSLASALGASAAVVGLLGSYALSQTFGVGVPAGPVIVLVAASSYGASVVLVRLVGLAATGADTRSELRAR